MKLLRIEKKIIDQVILVYMHHALLMILMFNLFFATAAERAQVEQFFKDSALSDRPVVGTVDDSQKVGEPVIKKASE